MAQSREHRAAIAAMGRTLGPDVLRGVQELYRAEQGAHAAQQPATAVDRAYGDHPRQKLDVYAPIAARQSPPVLLFVHGGGFLRGEKSSVEHPYGAHVGRWAAREGMLGVVMNYRLAPDDVWPSGGEDVGAAIDWLHVHAGQFGGDPEHIVALGTSAGAVHVATHLKLRGSDHGLAGAVLLSGLYGYTPLDDRDMLYFGAQESYAERMPRAAVVETDLPLLIACAEHDPQRFQAEFTGLLADRLERHATLPRALVAAGHNHYSLAMHLGTADTRLSTEIAGFIDEVAA